MTANEFNLGKWMNSPEYERLKEINRKEINKYPIVIDYSAFKHTPEEKGRLYGEKKEWKRLHSKTNA